MSILIKGMEMPKEGCYHRICINPDGTVPIEGGMYEAIPVPPHGDLIEKSIIEKAIEDSCAECEEMCLEFDGLCADCDACVLSLVKKALTDAPTIIPADPSEEGE